MLSVWVGTPIGGSWDSAYPAAAQERAQPRLVNVDSPEKVLEHFRKRGKSVVTFCGYSGLGYEKPEAMLQHAREVLSQYDPEKTIVNCGATAVGIGQVYEVAKSLKFSTTGIVSSLARENPGDISPHADVVFW